MKITVKIHPHNTAELKQLSELLGNLSMSSRVDQSAADQKITQHITVKTTKAEAPKAEDKIGSAPPIKVVIPKAEAPKVDTGDVTIESIRLLVQSKIQAGHRDSIKKYLNKFEASNVSALKPENFVEFSDLITKLK